MTAEPVTISTAFDPENEQWEIQATSYGRVQPAGPRLFRAAPHPDIAFSHADKAAAEKDAATLRRYLEELSQRKGPSRAKLRKLGAD